MSRLISSICAAVLFLPALTAAQEPAQPQEPARIGNIWGNEAHQPTRADVREQEKAAGLRGSATQEQQRTNEIEQLEKQVLQGTQQGPGAATSTQP